MDGAGRTSVTYRAWGFTPSSVSEGTIIGLLNLTH